MKNEMITILGKIKELAANVVELCEVVSSSIGLFLPDEEKKVIPNQSSSKASFATNEEDWNNYRDEELAHDDAQEEKEVKPEPKKVISLEDVRKVLADYSRNGKTAEVKAILTKYGYEKLSLVDPKDYEAILKDAEVLK